MKPGGVVNRYLPFIAIAALQLVLVVMQPSGAPTQIQGQGAIAPGAAGFPGQYVDGTAGAVAGGDPAAVSVTGGVPGAAGAAQARGVAAGPAAAGAAAALPQVDQFGRPLSGDKSKCAPGGLLQQAVTRLSPPCIPKFVGDNGGATYQGVTSTEIVGVYFLPRPNPELDALLATQGLAVSPEQNKEILELLTKFVNKRYELYGRQFKWIQHVGSCTNDPNCPQIEAKAILAKYKPFVVSWWIGGASAAPEAFAREIARNGVLQIGAPGSRTDAWYQREQTIYQLWPSGTHAVDTVAAYYCKRMQGKNATLAGDPTMRVKKRKLGIITVEVPDLVASAERLKSLVSGGVCGSAADGTTVYVLTADPAQQADHANALITRMRNDGVTTIHNATGGLACSSNCDQQNYQPENFFGSPGPYDADVVHRLLQTSKTQAANTFGLGWFGDDGPVQDQDHARAIKDVAPNYGEVPYVTLGVFHAIDLTAKLVQWAGPRLSPQQIRRAADAFPQLNGWTNASPWPGWKCCDASMFGFKFGPGRYTAISDSRHIYWDNAAVSKVDQKPGAWVCPDGCKRYEPSQFTAGEPKQA